MLTRTHLAFTVFALFVLNKFFSLSFVLIFVALVTTFLPDIDIPTSKIGKKKFSRIFQLFFSHRGFLHSVFFFLIIFCVLFFVGWRQIAFGFLIGYGSHVFLDSLTVRGIPIFLKKRVRGKLKTGKTFEEFLFIALLIFDVYFGLALILDLNFYILVDKSL